MKRLIILISILLFGGIGGFYFLKPNSEEIHYHAGFAVFKDETQVDFSDIKYMKVSPCALDKESVEHEDEQLEKAHLHDSIGDVVHIEREDAKWSDLFTNLKYAIAYSTAKAFINGTEVSNFQDLPIQPYDSIVILIGENDTQKTLDKAVNRTHIEEIENRSEDCGT